MQNSPAKSFDIRKANWNDPNMFPDYIYFDTNAVLEMLLPNRRFHNVTKDYVNELHSKDGIILWSPFVTQELYDFFQNLENLAGGKRLGFTGRDNEIAKKYENIATKIDSAATAQLVKKHVDNTELLLSNYGIKLDVSNDISSLASGIHLLYGSNIKDANHIAVCQYNEVNNVLTHDGNKGFLRYDNYNVYGASRGITSNYTSEQTKNQFINIFI